MSIQQDSNNNNNNNNNNDNNNDNNNNVIQENSYNKLMNSFPTRWEIELEFVQSLSNLPYVSYLAQNNYLKDEKFINYLNYLQYWNNPNYSKYLVYPNCLHILNLLQQEQFRNDIINPDFVNKLMNDMIQRWQENEIQQPQIENNKDNNNTSNTNTSNTNEIRDEKDQEMN
ncbi:unnamed protein product [Candida verbasci]|uniref:Mediator of RNA polymerase II transcription subunit 31 n=1 Tax=Candida verbasci TaxID=1227364 RepID=A0A9W4TXK2_9ASCO|nr:unnamed protein product [Candida verbasci]